MDTPEWVVRFVNKISAAHTTEHSIEAPQLRWYSLPPGHEDGLKEMWLVSFFPALIEIVSGPQDGALWFSWREVDLLAIQAAFDEVTSMGWLPDSDGSDGSSGSMLICEGVVEGHLVQLSLDQFPPADAPTISYNPRTCAMWEKE